MDLKKNNGSTSLEFRKRLSQEAFNLTAYYDSVISEYLNENNSNYFPKKKNNPWKFDRGITLWRKPSPKVCNLQ